MFSIIGKIFDWIFSFFGNIFSSFTLRDQNAFLQTKLLETQKELAPFKEKLAVSDITKAQLETENAQLKARLAQLEQKNEQSFDLDANAFQLLRLLAQNDSRLTIQAMETVLELPRVEVQYSVDGLLKHRFLQGYRPNSIRDAPRYGLSKEGRSFIIEGFR